MGCESWLELSKKFCFWNTGRQIVETKTIVHEFSLRIHESTNLHNAGHETGTDRDKNIFVKTKRRWHRTMRTFVVLCLVVVMSLVRNSSCLVNFR